MSRTSAIAGAFLRRSPRPSDPKAGPATVGAEGFAGVLPMGDRHAVRQRPVNRTPRGDLREPLTLLVAQIAAQEKLEVDRGNLPLPDIARQARLDPVHRPALAFGIQPNREH